MIKEFLLPYIPSYGIAVSFLGGFIGGETIIVILAFLSAHGFLPLWYLFVFSLAGMYLSDFIPFTIGKFKWFRNFVEKKKFFNKGEKLEKILLRRTKGNLFLTLFYTKIVYGAAIPALIYLGYRKVSYCKFAFYNLLVELIFVPIIIGIGWLGGKGFGIATNIFKDIRIASLLLVALIFILYFIKKWIDQRLIKTQEQ